MKSIIHNILSLMLGLIIICAAPLLVLWLIGDLAIWSIKEANYARKTKK